MLLTRLHPAVLQTRSVVAGPAARSLLLHKTECYTVQRQFFLQLATILVSRMCTRVSEKKHFGTCCQEGDRR